MEKQIRKNPKIPGKFQKWACAARFHSWFFSGIVTASRIPLRPLRAERCEVQSHAVGEGVRKTELEQSRTFTHARSVARTARRKDVRCAALTYTSARTTAANSSWARRASIRTSSTTTGTMADKGSIASVASELMTIGTRS